MDQTVKIEMQCSTCSRARYGHKFNHGFPIYCNFDGKAKCDDDLCVHWKLSESARHSMLSKKIGHSEYMKQLWGLRGPGK